VSVAVVEVVSLSEVFESVKHSLDQNTKVGAGIANLVLVVRDDDKGAVGSLDHQLLAAFLGEATVSHGHDLVDQVAVELDGHGDGKGQSCLHPGGVSPDRLPEVSAQLGEVLDEGYLVLDRLAVDPANELEVIESCQLSLKGPAEGERPGEAHSTVDLTARWCFRSADESDEGGFARSIATQKPYLLPALDPEGDPVEDRALTSTNGILFCDFPKLDHANSRQ